MIYFCTAFRQSYQANIDIYVTPPKSFYDRNKLWILESAAYGIVNSNYKGIKCVMRLLAPFLKNPSEYLTMVSFPTFLDYYNWNLDLFLTQSNGHITNQSTLINK